MKSISNARVMSDIYKAQESNAAKMRKIDNKRRNKLDIGRSRVMDDIKHKLDKAESIESQQAQIVTPDSSKLGLLNFLTKNPFMLQKMDDQPADICFMLLINDPSVYEHINTPTKEMTLYAVTQDGNNLEHVKGVGQTEDIVLAAVSQNGHSVQYAENKTEKICLAAANENGYSLKYMTSTQQTESVCLAAVKENGDALKFVKTQTDKVNTAAVKKHGLSLKYIKNQTKKIVLEAKKQNRYAVHYEIDTSRVKKKSLFARFKSILPFSKPKDISAIRNPEALG